MPLVKCYNRAACQIHGSEKEEWGEPCKGDLREKAGANLAGTVDQEDEDWEGSSS